MKVGGEGLQIDNKNRRSGPAFLRFFDRPSSFTFFKRVKMNLIKKTFSFAVLQAALIGVTLFSAADVSAQSLSSRGRRLADMLAAGVLPMTDLTRNQQAVFGPVILDQTMEINDELFDELDNLLFMLGNVRPGSNAFDALFEEANEVFAEIAGVANAQDFVVERILFGTPRSPRRAFTVSQLLARARARRVPAIVGAVGGRSNLNVQNAIVNQLSDPRHATLAVFFNANFDPEVLSDQFSSNVTFIGRLLGVSRRRARSLTISANASVLAILAIEFGL